MPHLEDRTIFHALLLVLAVVAAAFFYSLANPRLPEGFTEVYFTKNPETSQGAVQAQFMVANREGKPIDYRYEVFLGGEMVAEGSVRRADGEVKAVELDHKLSAPLPGKTKLLIKVSREGKPEPYTLWYWVGG